MADLMSAFVQPSRLLKLTLAPGSGIDENVILPYELSGIEGISEGLRYTLTCLSSDAFLELNASTCRTNAAAIILNSRG